jgi:hypothetical protein
VPFALAACSIETPHETSSTKHLAPDPSQSEPDYPPDMEVNQGGAPPSPEEEDAGTHADAHADANADADADADANADAEPDAGPILPN